MASLYQRKNSKYWWIKYKINGKDFYESTKCTKKFDADIILKKKYLPLETNRYNRMNVLPVKLSLEEALNIFRDNILLLGDYGRAKGKKSINRDQTNVNNFSSYLQEKGIKDFQDISEETIKDYIQIYSTIKLKKKPNTLNKELRIVKKFFKWAVKNYYINFNPAEQIPNPKADTKAPRYFSKEELNLIFTNAKDPYKDIFKILYLTGLRVGELCNLEWNDYQEEQKKLIVRVKDGNKTKRECIIPLSKSSVTIFNKLFKTRKQNSPLVFANRNLNKPSPNKIYDYLIRLLQRLKITNASTHTFRHTCASHLVSDGVSLYIVKELLRHKSIDETQIYAHLSIESTQNAIEKLSLDFISTS